VEPWPAIPSGTRFLIVTPRIRLSTELIYKEFDRYQLTSPGATGKLKSVPDPVPDGGRLLRCLFNELEEWVLQAYPPVKAARGLMKRFCPSGVLLSGTGPTLFGVVSAEKTDEVGIGPIFPDSRLAALALPTSSGYRFLL
jgi:4-diphosphocytidyl-2C-methyl-D-erythritol kinase